MTSAVQTKTASAAAATLLLTFCMIAAVNAQEQKIELQAAPAELVEAMLEDRQPARWVPGQVIVKFKEDAELPAGAQIAGLSMAGQDVTRTSGGETIFTLPLDMSTAALTEDAGKRTYSVAEAMQERPEVEYAQVNYILDIAAVPDDPFYESQWHYFNNGAATGESRGGINLPKAWDISTGDAAVVVAVIDTGILPGHPDISGSPNQAGGFDMISSPFTANDGDGRDSDPSDAGDAVAFGECFPASRARPDSWHGTHVAGTIGAGGTDNDLGVAGINWQAKIVSVRVLGKCGGATTDINDAIRWAAGLPVPGVQNIAQKANIINMSLGGPIPCTNSPSTQAAINDAVDEGVTVIVAAGNDAMNAANAMPASCENVITVAASDNSGSLETNYSNFGDVVDIMAPGGDVTLAAAGGVLSTVNGGYAFYQGTSMATPHVAGVAALVLSNSPGMSPQALQGRLETTAMSRTEQQCPPNRKCGAGLLDAFAALGGVEDGEDGEDGEETTETPLGWMTILLLVLGGLVLLYAFRSKRPLNSA